MFSLEVCVHGQCARGERHVWESACVCKRVGGVVAERMIGALSDVRAYAFEVMIVGTSWACGKCVCENGVCWRGCGVHVGWSLAVVCSDLRQFVRLSGSSGRGGCCGRFACELLRVGSRACACWSLYK